jgi:cytochrome c-type biogenesis protein CcmH
MTIFWIVSALLLLGGLLMLLPALLGRSDRQAAPASGAANVAVYRDQLKEAEAEAAAGLLSEEGLAQRRVEISRRVLDDVPDQAATVPAGAASSRRTAVALAVLLPLASIGTYLMLGHPEAVSPTAVVTSQGTAQGKHSLGPEQIQGMVTALAERLKADPGNAEGWLMLGRSYTALGRYRDAATAFRRASELLPQDAGVLADLADVVGMAQGKRLAGEPASIVQRALDIDPRHVKALALAGSVAFEARDFANARAYWQRLVAVVPADSPLARSVQGSIAEATQLEAGGGLIPVADRSPAPPAAAASAQAAPATGAPASASASVSGEVVLSPELAARVAAGDTLFIFARAEQGPRMPLAIVRRQAGDWPQRFTLDDSMAMAPNLKLSGFPGVVVGARISRSGQAMPQPGDLIGQGVAVAPGATGLRIVIDRVQP